MSEGLGTPYFCFFFLKRKGTQILLNLTSRLREVRSPRKNSPRETELRIFSEMARIWENSCKDFPLNRCYVFFLQEKMPKRSVGIVPKIFFV